MKIYTVTRYDSAFSWFFYGTKKEAEKDARRFRQQYKEEDDDSATVEVECLEVTPTREGIASALQDFVDMTCINEH